MLAGQSEKDEKSSSSTQEVSIETLNHSNSNPEHLDVFAENSLRRRRIIINESKREFQLDNKIRLNNTSSQKNSEKSPKIMKYPKIMSSYPKLLLSSNNKIHPHEELPRAKKLTNLNSKPPLAKAPVFLKCNIKKKLSPNDNNNSESPTTDLDIQLRRLKFKSFSMSSSSSDSERRSSLTIDNNVGQSLTQYCNFDEKKIVKVAPHIRRKDVICDTVDAWSRGPETDLSRSKPLIFGGTYPIDFPLRTNHRGTIYTPKTFQIDAPEHYVSEEL